MEVIRSWLPPLSWGNSLISHGSALFMMFGGVLPYVPQYREILRTKNADGFSTFVCLALLVANILRIFFWFCVRFETPLLIQSIIMTTAMLLMIHLCIRTRREQLITPPPKTKTFHDLEWRHFWQWTDFLSYVECTIIFTIIAGSVVFLFKDVTVVVEFVGLVAVLTEALLGMPQFYKNFVNKSTAGMSTSMVMLWLFGDVFKTAYFVLRDSPVQFVLCGILQVAAPTRTHNTPVDSPQGSIEGMMLILQQQQPTASSSYLVGCRLEESSGSGYIPSFGGATLDMPEAKSRQGCNHVTPVAECGSRTDMCLSLGEGHSLGCINSSGIDGTMRREDFEQQQVRMPLDDDDLLRQDFEDFEVGSEPLKRGFSDTIYDFDVPLSSLPNFTAVQASPQEEKLNFEELMISGSTAELGRTCPLAKEETFSSLELSEESDENKMFVRGEGTPDTSIAS